MREIFYNWYFYIAVFIIYGFLYLVKIMNLGGVIISILVTIFLKIVDIVVTEKRGKEQKEAEKAMKKWEEGFRFIENKIKDNRIINNRRIRSGQNVNLIETKPNELLIKEIFSEGAYEIIFKSLNISKKQFNVYKDKLKNSKLPFNKEKEKLNNFLETKYKKIIKR